MLRVAEQQVQQQHARTRAPSLLFPAIRTRGIKNHPRISSRSTLSVVMSASIKDSSMRRYRKRREGLAFCRVTYGSPIDNS